MKKLGDSMWKEAQSIKAHALRLAWHMRGGASYVDILNMSNEEVNILNKLVEENMDTTKKSGLPYF